MIQKDIIEKIIEAAAHAPSGDNCQPWRFVVEDGVISIFNLPERDNSLYSWGQRASMVAIGAAIENMRITAANFGFESTIKYFPNTQDANHVASLTFVESGATNNSLYDKIPMRITNRKPYQANSIRAEELDLLKRAESPETKISFTQDLTQIKLLAKAAATNELILFENQPMHKFFYDHISWNKEEDARKSIGFYIKTLEIPPVGEIGFKLFRNWKTLSFFNRLMGFSKTLAKQNGAIYGSAPAFGVITISNREANSFVHAGEVFQELWLMATEMNLSLQPLTGVVFMHLKLLAKDNMAFSGEHQQQILQSYQDIENVFQTSGRTIAVMFRVGRAPAPSAHSTRLKPEVEYK